MSQSLVTLLPVTEDHYPYVLQIRNLPSVRKACYDNSIISPEDHLKYMKRFESDPDWHQWCVVIDDQLIGYAKLVDQEFGYMIHDEHRGKGYSNLIMEAVISKARDIGYTWLLGVIRTNESVPLLIACKNGFNITSIKTIKGQEYFTLIREGI